MTPSTTLWGGSTRIERDVTVVKKAHHLRFMVEAGDTMSITAMLVEVSLKALVPSRIRLAQEESAMGGRISLGQVRPKRRKMQDTPCDSFIAPGFDEDELFTVSPTRRPSRNDNLYLDRGAMHGAKGPALFSVPEASEEVRIPGVPEH